MVDCNNHACDRSFLSRIKNLRPVPEDKSGALRESRPISLEWHKGYLRIQAEGRERAIKVPLVGK
jgi:hypothetical protein